MKLWTTSFLLVVACQPSSDAINSNAKGTSTTVTFQAPAGVTTDDITLLMFSPVDGVASPVAFGSPIKVTDDHCFGVKQGNSAVIKTCDLDLAPGATQSIVLATFAIMEEDLYTNVLNSLWPIGITQSGVPDADFMNGCRGSTKVTAGGWSFPAPTG